MWASKEFKLTMKILTRAYKESEFINIDILRYINIPWSTGLTCNHTAFAVFHQHVWRISLTIKETVYQNLINVDNRILL